MPHDDSVSAQKFSAVKFGQHESWSALDVYTDFTAALLESLFPGELEHQLVLVNFSDGSVIKNMRLGRERAPDKLQMFF